MANASGLGGDANATSTFSLDATPEPSTVAMVLGGCRFEVYYAEQGSADRVFSGTMVIQAMPADDFALFYGGGTAVPGLGDEYSDMGTTVMRVGGVMLSVGENSLSEGFVQAMFAKMVPNLA